jgi:hypothetical protein
VRAILPLSYADAISSETPHTSIPHPHTPPLLAFAGPFDGWGGRQGRPGKGGWGVVSSYRMSRNSGTFAGRADSIRPSLSKNTTTATSFALVQSRILIS